MNKKRYLFPGLAILFVFLVIFSLRGSLNAQNETLRPGLSQSLETAPGTVEEGKIKKKRLREGTIIKDKLARFYITGNRVTMHLDDGSERYICLENVNLDRIIKHMREHPAQRLWKIDGMMTEYQGDNFILIQKSIIAPSYVEPEQPAPETRRSATGG